ncbi:hypothetical protein VPH35_053698 [Triticum aestivum]
MPRRPRHIWHESAGSDREVQQGSLSISMARPSYPRATTTAMQPAAQRGATTFSDWPSGSTAVRVDKAKAICAEHGRPSSKWAIPREPYAKL